MDKSEKFSRFLQYQEHSNRSVDAARIKWKPLRYATREGWVLAAWTWRTFRDHAQIGLFVTEDHLLYKEGSALKWALRCIFTQAFHQVGSLEIRFIGNSNRNASLDSGVEPEIPREIRKFAEHHQIRFECSDRIQHNEGELLYYAATDFDAELVEKLRSRKLDPLRACYLSQREVWSMDQIRYIFEHGSNPERIFLGGAQSTSRISFLRELCLLRPLIMAERLVILLEKTIELRCKIDFNWATCDVAFVAPNRDIQLKDTNGLTIELRGGEDTKVLFLPILPDVADGLCFSEPQLEKVGFVCVPKDFQAHRLHKALSQVSAIALYDTLDDIDNDVEMRMAHTMQNRANLQERHV